MSAVQDVIPYQHPRHGSQSSGFLTLCPDPISKGDNRYNMKVEMPSFFSSCFSHHQISTGPSEESALSEKAGIRFLKSIEGNH
jgi:hypothetical protein